MKNTFLISFFRFFRSAFIENPLGILSRNSINLITLSGFKKDNPLKKIGNINFYINSNQYNFIEMCHHIILVYLVDVFTKKN